MNVSKFPEYDNHELISYFNDAKTGLRGFIAIHNTNLGPATGGTRYFPYKSEEEALRDVLKLSRSMTYKCALANVPYGGGKAVIIANPKIKKSEKFLKAYADRINLFNGKFTTGEDVGIDVKDIDFLSSKSKFIFGRSNVAGDLGPWAALGVFYSIKASLEFIFKSSDFEDRTFAIKGLGKVGYDLLNLIYESGGRKIFVADINTSTLKKAQSKFPEIKIVSPLSIHKQKVDVYAPCAMGGDFNQKNIKDLKCRIICGGANNQLETSEIGFSLHKLGITYIPDYLANAGGMINVLAEHNKSGYKISWVKNKCKEIENTTRKILLQAAKNNKPPILVADLIAESRFSKFNSESIKYLV